jgi:hypothetical protein
VGDDRHRWPLEKIVGRLEPPAKNGCQSEHWKVAGCGVLDRHGDQVAVLSVEVAATEGTCSHRVEHVVVVCDIEEGWVRRRAGTTAVLVLENLDQAIGSLERRWLEEHRVHDAERCGVQADRQSEDRQHGEAEQGTANQPSRRVRQVG